MTEITDSDLILVTGASGYVASHIVKLLLEKGYRVRGTVRSLKNEKKVDPLRKLVENPKHPLELCEADLDNEESWLKAVEGCTYVMHTASPFPNTAPKDENELIVPALNGTLFVLRACVQEGSKVKRVVLTSSVAAIYGSNFKHGYVYSEKDWANPDECNPYEKSKTLAEKAAWDFIKERKEKNQSCFELAVINPGFVLGPVLHDCSSTSIDIITKFMIREKPIIANLYFAVCDARDVALAHLNALVKPEAVNNRHMVANSINSSSVKEWTTILYEEFSPKKYYPPTMVAPDFLIWLASFFDGTVSMVVPLLSKVPGFDNSRLKDVLGVQPIPLKKTLIDMVYSMIDRGILPKRY